MKPCRLKIITANIIDGVDTPSIKYISQNDPNSFYNESPYIKTSLINYVKEKKEGQIDNKTANFNESKNIINRINLQELVRYDMENDNTMNLNNSLGNINFLNENFEENNIDINDLCTVSNQQMFEDIQNNIFNNMEVNDCDTIENYINSISNQNNYENGNNKKQSNTKIKNVIKKKENKTSKKNVNRSLSNNSKAKTKSVNKDINKKNLQYTNTFSTNNNVFSNDNLKINKKKIGDKFSFKNRSKSKNSNPIYKNDDKNKKESKNIMENIKPLKINEIKKNNNLRKTKSNYSWNIVEQNDFNNYEKKVDYKILVNELIKKESLLSKEKLDIIQSYEQKLKPLKELNKKLMEENNEELGREDELKGELILLKNQYEKLISQIKTNKNNKFQEKNDNKIKEIDDDIKKLNDNLKNGEILLVMRPSCLENLTDEEDKNITLMLRGLFASLHALDTDKIVDIIWKYNKQVQTIYFLVRELINYFRIEPNLEKNILLNYFYSFLKEYNYMNIDTFKKLFKNKIGEIKIYNKNFYISELLNNHRSQIDKLIKSIKDKDNYNIGIIKLKEFNNMLKNEGLFLSINNDKEYQDYQFLIYCMKKDRTLEINKSKKQISKKVVFDNYDIRYSLFDLFYKSLIDFIDEYNSLIIRNPFQRIKTYMKNKNINSDDNILKSLLIEKNIIKVNNKEYIDIILLNKFLRRIGIIQNNEVIYATLFEEELVEINKFMNDIINYKI